ncbi:Hypothetical predicted protein [Paramuricea clavata]|uniref:Uncharacterized protein n=1 Tax=Paramuricea clavata TaxID=317549 RepID=A0A7D9D6B5_PARCT|nr:Hypothetical predicted protein [Paramuricea clavata]
MKPSRAQYRRKWVAAARTLQNTNHHDPNMDNHPTVDQHPNVDLDQLIELPLNSVLPDNSDPDNSDPEIDEEQSEPSRKRLCGAANGSLHEEGDIGGALASWANEFLVKHNAMDSLLALLKKRGHPNLPSSARTLLGTKRSISVQVKSGMDYVYLPLAAELLKHFKRHPPNIVDHIDSFEISLNVDGLPLFKSCNKTLWPVLCAIVNVKPVVVFPVVLAYGNSKPKDLEFLENVIRDLGDVLENGLQDGNRVLPVSLRCVVCDAPARALVKGTKLCSGYFGCDKCAQKGMWVGRVFYPLIKDIDLRSDYSFREQVNEGHNLSVSPFYTLPIDMIKKFPIDYMHQLCLGVTRKLILTWIRGSWEVKLSAGQVEEISNRLTGLKPFVPSFFARKPRGMAEIDRWKATEYRQFLVYTGQIVLSGILRPDLYDHFLCLSVASSILICPRLALLHRPYAKQLMEYFVEQGKKLKRLVRSGKNPIAQIAKRLSESYGAIPQSREAVISLKKPDNCFILTDSSCCEMTTTGFAVVEFVDEKSVEIICEKWTETCDGVMYSYWPQLNAKGEAKKAEIPDKELWKKYKIRVLSYTDNFKMAQKWLKKAEETSNVDSESDSDGCARRKRSKPNTRRKRSRPGGYHYAELSECFDGNETDNLAREENLTCPALTPLLPAAPIFPVASSPGLNRNGDFSAALISAVNTVFDSIPSDVSCDSRPLHSSIPCTSTSSPNYSNSQRQHQHGLNKSTTNLNNENPVLTHNGKSTSTKQDQQDSAIHAIIFGMLKLVEKRKTFLT